MANHIHRSRGNLRACPQCAGSPEAAERGAAEQRAIDATMYDTRQQGGAYSTFEIGTGRGPRGVREAQRRELAQARAELGTDASRRRDQKSALAAARKALRES